MIAIPLFGDQVKVTEGLYKFDVNPSFVSLASKVITPGRSISEFGYTATVQSVDLSNGSMSFVALFARKPNTTIEAGVTFQQVFFVIGGIAALVGAGYLFDRIYKVVDNPAVELAIIAGVLVVLYVLFKKLTALRR